MIDSDPAVFRSYACYCVLCDRQKGVNAVVFHVTEVTVL
jgi:hypothetical protein